MDSGKGCSKPPIIDPLKHKPKKTSLTRWMGLGSFLGDLLSVSQLLILFSSFIHSFFGILNLNSMKTILAIAFSVFQELSTAHRENQPTQELYTIMRIINSNFTPGRVNL